MSVRLFPTNTTVPIFNSQEIGWVEIQKHEYGQHCSLVFLTKKGDTAPFLFPTVSLRNQVEIVSNNEKGNIIAVGKVVAVNAVSKETNHWASYTYEATKTKLEIVGTENPGYVQLSLEGENVLDFKVLVRVSELAQALKNIYNSR